jgi:Uma2 family endonuclease
MATVKTRTSEQRIRSSNVDWREYLLWSQRVMPRRLRVTYDQGELEAMTLSSEHEGAKKLLAQLIEALTAELGIERVSKGSMTFQREDLLKGAEPDECWWITNEAAVRGKKKIDPLRDPPPDLIVEVEITRSTLDRMAIWAALGVSEVWRYNGKALTFCTLSAEGVYETRERSLVLPFLRAKALQRFLRQPANVGEVQWMLSFRQWVQEQEAKGWRKPSPNSNVR